MRGDIEQALELLRSEQPDALERALAAIQDTVYSFSMKVCGHREDAEDTMQDVLVKAMPYLPKFESSRALAVWLYKVAKNRCLMSRRRSKFNPRENLSLHDLMPDEVELGRLMRAGRDDPESSLLKVESAAEVHKAVLRIPPLYRLVLVLHDMEELSTADVARITGMREGTVRVRLHRARLFLRNELSGRGNQHRHTGAKKPKQPRSAHCRRLFAALSDYLDEEADGALCDEIQSHLAGCAPCEAFLNSLAQTIGTTRAFRGERPHPRIAARVRKVLLA